MSSTRESLKISSHELPGTFSLQWLLLTFSHAGLVSRCGKAIDETLREDRSTVTYEEWIRYATFKLSTAVRRYPTVTKLIDTLQRTDEKMKAAREFLYRRFLPNEHSVEIYDSTERRLASFLASEGALRHVTEEEYEVQSSYSISL